MNGFDGSPGDFEDLNDAQRKSRQRQKRPQLKLTNTDDIMATVYPQIMWVLPGYLPEGFSVLAGRQKLGKTWLAIDFAIAVETGGCALGSIECEQGDVLYIDMENGPRRIQRRIRTIFPKEGTRPNLAGLNWVSEAPPLDKGLIDCLEDWRTSAPKPDWSSSTCCSG